MLCQLSAVHQRQDDDGSGVAGVLAYFLNVSLRQLSPLDVHYM